MVRQFTTTERIAEKLHRADEHIRGLTGVFVGDDDGTELTTSHIDPVGDFIHVKNVQRSLAVEVVFPDWSDGRGPMEVIQGLKALYSGVSTVFADLRQFL